MTADTTAADAFADGQRKAHEADRVALVAALGMDPATTWEEALEHAGGRYTAPAGWEAEELRHAMERHTRGPVADEMQAILDDVDARDSLRWLEEKDAAREEGRRAGLEEAAAQCVRNANEVVTIADAWAACRACANSINALAGAASRYSTASDAAIARESEPGPAVTTIYDVEGDL